MAHPLLLLAGGVGTILGLKKFAEARDDNEKASLLNSCAAALVEASNKKLEAAQSQAEHTLEQFDVLRRAAWDRCLGRLATLLAQVEFEGSIPLATTAVVKPTGTNQLRGLVPYQGGALGTGATAVIAAGASGVAVYGFVQAVGTASTGTPISSLRGAAARNATLASLGGGSKRSGGGGTAGGQLALGVTALGAGLAFGGGLAAAEASGNRAIAEANFAQAQKHEEETALLIALVGSIAAMVHRLTNAMDRLEGLLVPQIDEVGATICRAGTDYRRYSQAEREQIHRTLGVAVLLKKLLELPILAAGGTLTDGCLPLAEKVEGWLLTAGSPA